MAQNLIKRCQNMKILVISLENFITEMNNILNDFDDLKKDSSNDTKTNNNSNTSNLNLTITEQNSKYEENKEENKDTIDKDNIDNYNENDNDNDNENENENEDVVTKNINYNICPLCNIPGEINDTLIICEKCGMERIWDAHTSDTYSMTIDQNYNTTNNSFMAFSIVGNGSYCYNRSLLKTCANYSVYRNSNNKKDIINKIYQYEGNKPPANVIKETSELFDEIKNKGYVYRGDSKLGVIAACMYYISIKNNLPRTPKEISSIFKIDEKFLSQGDRIIQELNELGVINIQTNYRPVND